VLTGVVGIAGWVALSMLVAQLVAIAWIDARHMIIPDGLNALLFATAAASALVTQTPSPAMALAGALAAPAVLAGVRWAVSRRTGREAMGLGDVKFAAGAGAWVGLESLPLLLVVASGAGLAAALAGRHDAEGRLPFGPFLALGTGVAKAAALLGWPG
jgi:leader peptidase (prepilin peptidase)/N-methyltransferase